MKASLLIVSFLLGTAAVAQTTTPNASATSAAPGTGAMTSADATASASAASDSSTAASAVDTSNYPVCSRTVTDKCVQRGAPHKAHRRG